MPLKEAYDKSKKRKAALVAKLKKEANAKTAAVKTPAKKNKLRKLPKSKAKTPNKVESKKAKPISRKMSYKQKLKSFLSKKQVKIAKTNQKIDNDNKKHAAKKAAKKNEGKKQPKPKVVIKETAIRIISKGTPPAKKKKNVAARKAKNESWKRASSSAKKSGLTISALVAKRKTLKKGSKEYAVIQNRINKAYGSKKVHGYAPATKKKVLKKTKSLSQKHKDAIPKPKGVQRNKKKALAGKVYSNNSSSTLKKVMEKKTIIKPKPKPKPKKKVDKTGWTAFQHLHGGETQAQHRKRKKK
tara:strand:- start:5652 stop:6548 length:897 start_codon:yes stop_codon:yes gene_type:complete